jgi:hypothetical protein
VRENCLENSQVFLKRSRKLNAKLKESRKVFGPGMGKIRRVKSNPHSKIDPIMSGH